MSLRPLFILNKSKVEIINNTLWEWFMHENLLQSDNPWIHTPRRGLGPGSEFLERQHHVGLDGRIPCLEVGGGKGRNTVR